MAFGDLTDLFTAQPDTPAQPWMYRQGVIQTFNPVTLENTVLVGRTLLTNLQVLGVAEAASYREGTVVGIAVIGSGWAIVGQLVTPGTDQAEDAITQLGQRLRMAVVNTSEATSSAPFVDLATVGPTVPNVLIPASGKALVTIFANIGGPAGTVGVSVTGDTTIAPSTFRSLLIANAGLVGSSVIPFDSLPAGGRCTFQLKYGSGSGSCTFSDRVIVVQTL